MSKSNFLEKNDIIELETTDLGINGEGVARRGGLAVFVRGALAGELVRAQVISVKSSFAVARMLQILRPSPDRILAPCPYFGKCGGCDIQHLSYDAQLTYKRRQLEATMRKILGSAVPVSDVMPSPSQLGYRNKLSLPVAFDGTMGFFAQNSHRIIGIEQCLIQSGRLNRLMQLFGQFLAERGIAGFDEQRGRGVVRHLVARVFGDLVIIAVVVTGQGVFPMTEFRALLDSQLGAEYILWLNVNTAANNVILGDRWQHICGQSKSQTVDGFCTQPLHPAAFWQVNDAVRGAIYDYVIAQIRDLAPDCVIDAYSGGGLLSARLAQCAPEVIAIEIVPQAVNNAKQFLSANCTENVTNICADCADALPKVLAKLSSQSRLATVVLDPPRKGCDPLVIKAVAQHLPPTVIYISCNPATLSRDIALLGDRYQIQSVQPFDMFPQTVHLETVTVLRASKA